MFTIGANPWIWTSPVDDAALASLVPRIAAWGFDAIEIPVENLGDWSPEQRPRPARRARADRRRGPRGHPTRP